MEFAEILAQKGLEAGLKFPSCSCSSLPAIMKCWLKPIKL